MITPYLHKMKITFLGTGTSQGVPVIGCDCPVCQSDNPKDKRLRCSIAIGEKGKRLIIDTGPDFREQLLRENIDDVHAILYTHEHKDHIAGLDDVRPINFLKKHDMPLYAEDRVIEALKREFYYAFLEKKYPGVPNLVLHEIDSNPFTVEHFEVTPIRVMHHKLPVFGFRINNFAYITDANYIAEEELKKLENLDVLVLNALRYEKHISHFNVEEALEVIERLQPKQTYLTHISHLLGLHDVENKKLPQNVQLAFDGLVIHIK